MSIVANVNVKIKITSYKYKLYNIYFYFDDFDEREIHFIYILSKHLLVGIFDDYHEDKMLNVQLSYLNPQKQIIINHVVQKWKYFIKNINKLKKSDSMHISL